MITYVDPLFEKAAWLILDNQDCSVILLQKHFAVGRRRSLRIINQLEETGIITLHSSSLYYEILVPNTNALREKLIDIKVEEIPMCLPEKNRQDEEKIQCSTHSDPLLKEAARIVIRDQDCSFTHLQRQLKLGYFRAKNIIKQLEQKGVIVYSINKNKQKILITEKDYLYSQLDK